MMNLLNRSLFAWLILVIITAGVVYGIIYTFKPMMLDDINYYVANGVWLETHHPAWLRWPTHIIGMWLNVNGRLGDSSNILWLNVVPGWTRGLIECICMVVLYGGIVAWMRRLGYAATSCVLATAILMFALPWWDAFGLYVVHINYLWAGSLTLAAFYIFFWRYPSSRLGQWLLGGLMLIAGAWHEAIGLPIVIAFSIVLAIKGFRTTCRIPLLLGILGGLYSILSPGIWMRVSMEHTPDDSLIPLIFKTVPLAVLLFIVVVYKLIRNPKALWEVFVANECRVGVLVAFSLTSAIIAVYSGIVGRSGWFAEVFSLTALAELVAPGWQRFADRFKGFAAMVAILLLGLMSIQTALTLICQLQADKETNILIDRYLHSPDGVVIADIPDYRTAPAILLNRVHYFPPIYDHWVQLSLKEHRASLSSQVLSPSDSIVVAQPDVVILPPAVAATLASLSQAPMKPMEAPGATILPKGLVAATVPEGVYPHRIEYNGIPIVLHIPIPPGDRPWN